MMRSLFVGICIALCQFLTYKCHATSVVEMYVAIDQKVVDFYVNHGSHASEAEALALTDAEYFLTEVNNILQRTGVDIEIRTVGIDVLAEDVFSDCQLRNGEGIHEDLGLQTFSRHLSDQGLFSSLNYDMALLFTGYNIYGQTDSVAGYASVGSMCTEDAVTIVEYDGTFRTVHVAAHEIGHVLGLDHDEGDCENSYVMTERLSHSYQRWTFSSCSISALSGLVPSYACLTDTDAGSELPDETQAAAHLLDANDMCRRARNYTDGYMCQSNNLYGNNPPQGDIICKGVYCHDDDGYCYLGYTTNGLICGTEERCMNGQCETAPADFPIPADTEAHCLYGDSAILNLNGMSEPTTCAEFLQPAARYQCYSSSIELTCCATCESMNSHIDGCEYGDRSSQCVLYTQNQVCPYYKDHLCCEFCQGWSSKRSADDASGGAPPVLTATDQGSATSDSQGKDEDPGDSTNTAE